MDHADPGANVYYRVDLTKKPAKFSKNGQGGVVVPLFADLKRHDMGDALAETFALASDVRAVAAGRLTSDIPSLNGPHRRRG